MTPDAAEDLKADLETAGFETTWGVEHAFGVEDLIIGVAVAAGAVGGFNGVAAVLNAFFHKNQHRSITLKSGDDEVTLTGLSKSESQAVIEAHLKLVEDQQRLLDESWHRVLDETGSTDPGDE